MRIFEYSMRIDYRQSFCFLRIKPGKTRKEALKAVEKGNTLTYMFRDGIVQITKTVTCDRNGAHMSDLIYCTYFKHIWEREEKYANYKLKDSDLTFTQSNALEYICHGEGQATQKDLENYMEIRHSAVVGIVSRLENKNLICSFEDPKDRRQKILRATPKGEHLNHEIQKDKEWVENRVITGFSDEEQRIFLSMLEKVYQNLAE